MHGFSIRGSLGAGRVDCLAVGCVVVPLGFLVFRAEGLRNVGAQVFVAEPPATAFMHAACTTWMLFLTS